MSIYTINSIKFSFVVSLNVSPQFLINNLIYEKILYCIPLTESTRNESDKIY